MKFKITESILLERANDDWIVLDDGTAIYMGKGVDASGKIKKSNLKTYNAYIVAGKCDGKDVALFFCTLNELISIKGYVNRLTNQLNKLSPDESGKLMHISNYAKEFYAEILPKDKSFVVGAWFNGITSAWCKDKPFAQVYTMKLTAEQKADIKDDKEYAEFEEKNVIYYMLISDIAKAQKKGKKKRDRKTDPNKPPKQRRKPSKYQGMLGDEPYDPESDLWFADIAALKSAATKRRSSKKEDYFTRKPSSVILKEDFDSIVTDTLGANSDKLRSNTKSKEDIAIISEYGDLGFYNPSDVSNDSEVRQAVLNSDGAVVTREAIYLPQDEPSKYLVARVKEAAKDIGIKLTKVFRGSNELTLNDEAKKLISTDIEEYVRSLYNKEAGEDEAGEIDLGGLPDEDKRYYIVEDRTFISRKFNLTEKAEGEVAGRDAGGDNLSDTGDLSKSSGYAKRSESYFTNNTELTYLIEDLEDVLESSKNAIYSNKVSLNESLVNKMKCDYGHSISIDNNNISYEGKKIARLDVKEIGKEIVAFDTYKLYNGI